MRAPLVRPSITALVLLAACAAPACRRVAPRPNVVLITFDTTRADHLGCYGHEPARTPVVDRLAAEGVLFEDAYASVPLTAPSHATLLTGKHPPAHGIRDNGLFVLPPEQRTLASILKAQGYRTAAAVGGFPLVSRFGLNQGFDLYDDRLTPTIDNPLGGPPPARPRMFFEERRAARVNEAVAKWLDANASQPFFLWLHYYDPHQPYQPPVPYDQTFRTAPYDGEIAYADESLGTLLDRVRRAGVYERTLVVFTSDHGEGLGEHGELTHSYLLYDTTLRVPLVMRGPGLPAGRRVAGRVRLVDVAPTVLDLLGIEIPPEMQGRSLRALWGSPAPPRVDRTHYAETLSPRLSQKWGEQRALIEDEWKYVHGPRPELFDLARDPRELRNLASAQPERAAGLKVKLEEFLKRNSPPGGSRTQPADEETRRQLQALGYLAAGAAGEEHIVEELRGDGIAPQDRAGDISALGRARDLIEKGDPLAARDIAQQLLVGDPDDPFYLEVLAVAELQLGRVDAALPAIERILAGGPSRGSAEWMLLQIGERRFADGDRAEGLRLARRSLELKPTADGYHRLASLLALAGQPREERAALQRALEVDPRFALARMDLAVRLAQEGRRDEARAELQRVVQENPYLARAHYNYGAFLVEEGAAEQALPYFERAVVLEPGYAKARLATVALRLQLGRRADAERAMRELAAQAPDSPEAGAARRLFEETR